MNDLPGWVESTSGIAWVAVTLWLLVVGRIRLDREVTAAEAATAAAEARADAAMEAAAEWREAYLLEVEARRNAEAATRHIMNTDSVVVSLVEALKRGGPIP